MTGTLQDVTERRRAEDALRASEAEIRGTLSLLNATLNSTADGILVVDTDGRIVSHISRPVDAEEITKLLTAGPLFSADAPVPPMPAVPVG